jgi:hypothetical protein
MVSSPRLASALEGARVIEQLVARRPLIMRKLIDQTPRYRWFASDQYAAPELTGEA